jgi:hypothetical protein
MMTERDYLGGAGDDEMIILDPRATLSSALVRAVVGYSDRRVRALAWLAVATPGLYARIAPIVEMHAIRQSPGAARSLREAIRALSLEEFVRRRDERRQSS